MQESAIEDYLKQQSKKYDFLTFKFAPSGINGVPDRLIIGNNQTIFIELKAPKKEPRPLQKQIITEMRDHGAIVYVIDNKADIDEMFKHHTKTNTPLKIGVF